MNPPALLGADDLTRCRDALLAADYTVHGVTAALGPVGEAALQRGDLAGCRRALREAPHGPLVTLMQLFLLGATVPASSATAAFGALSLAAAVDAGLVEASGHHAVRAALDVRPHASDVATEPWWVVSDLGTDVRPGVLDAEHVLGVGPAAVTLAGVVPRRPVHRALDVGTGSGVQALHLAGHSRQVVATDLSERALRFAATSWQLSRPGAGAVDSPPAGRAAADVSPEIEFRRGSLLAPVAGDRFDLVVANPPFVISPLAPAGARAPRFTYRDGGRAGDDLCRELTAGLPRVLETGGSAHLLANWLVTDVQPWDERVLGWLAASPGTDAWVWQREVADLGEYAALWLRDAGDDPTRPGYADRYDAWVDGLRALGAVAIGMGQIHLRRTGRADAVRVAEDVPGALIPPLGDTVAGWFDRADWLATVGRTAHDLRRTSLRLAPDVERVDAARPAPPSFEAADGGASSGWRPAGSTVRQLDGLRWEIEADEAVLAAIGACDGTRPLGLILDLLTLTRPELGPPDAVTARALPVVRDLIARGILEPA